MISKKMLTALTEQINLEYSAFYSYTAMGILCDTMEFAGCASWLEKQAGEEKEHAEKIVHYVLEQQETPILNAIDQPKANYKSLLEIFQASLAQEKHVTSSIHKIYELAVSEKDYATQVFLNWFVEEQVEEEASVTSVVERLKRIGEHTGALLTFDTQMGNRKD